MAEASGRATGASTVRNLSAVELVAAVAARQLHPREIIEEHLRGIEAEQHLNALITTCTDAALKRAQEPLEGPLAGLPLLVKDILDTEGIRTTYGSALFSTHIPSKSAAAVTSAEHAGAIVIGKANLHEFAWGTTSQNPHYGSVQNPIRPGKLAGGSSGGNAAALAACLCSIGLGTDTGGSARGPSACCSTVGYKAPYQAIPTAGCFPFAPSFDTVAPMSRSVADCLLLYTTLTHKQPRPATAAGLRIGILGRPPRVSPAGTVLEQPPAQRAWLHEQAARFEALGATTREVELPEPESDVLPAVLAEAAIAHHELYPAHRDQYGKDTREKLDLARSVTAIAAHEARLAIAAWRARAREQLAVDLVLCPTLGGDVPSMDAYEQDVRDVLLAYTRPFNLLDWSAIAIGDFQLTGPNEGVVLAAALAWEQAYGPPRPERERDPMPS